MTLEEKYEEVKTAYRKVVEDCGNRANQIVHLNQQLSELQEKYDAYRMATDIILKDYREQLCQINTQNSDMGNTKA